MLNRPTESMRLVFVFGLFAASERFYWIGCRVVRLRPIDQRIEVVRFVVLVSVNEGSLPPRGDLVESGPACWSDLLYETVIFQNWESRIDVFPGLPSVVRNVGSNVSPRFFKRFQDEEIGRLSEFHVSLPLYGEC